MHDYCDDVTDWLTVGGDLDLARDMTGLDHDVTIESLVQRGVTHVLDLRSEWEDERIWKILAPDVAYCHAPITDSHSHYVAESWYAKVEDYVEQFWLDSHDGDRLYVHCHMGINRAPSAAMLALLTVDPELDPYAAFLQIREARPSAGLIYAEQVGRRHLKLRGEPTVEWERAMRAYWTGDRVREVNRGIAYFRTQEGGTKAIGTFA